MNSLSLKNDKFRPIDGLRFLSGSPPNSGLVELRVRKKLAFLFCGTKGLGEYIIKPGCFVKLLAFHFHLQPSEGRFKADSRVEIFEFSGRNASNQVRSFPY